MTLIEAKEKDLCYWGTYDHLGFYYSGKMGKISTATPSR